MRGMRRAMMREKDQARQRKRAVMLAGNNGGRQDMSTFFAPLTSTDKVLSPVRGVGPATFTRASAQYITDHEGNARKVGSGSVAVEGSRVVTNLLTYSEDLSNAAWSISVVGTGSVNIGTDKSVTLSAIDSGDRAYVVHTLSGLTVNSGEILRVSWEQNVLTGTPNGRMFYVYNTGAITQEFRTLIGSGRVSSLVTFNTTAVNPILYIGVGVSSGVSSPYSINIRNIQVEVVTAQSNTNPGEYVKTTSAAVSKCFSTTNGNTVNGTTGVVTEATGTPLPQSYPERANSTAYSLNDKIQVSGWWYNCTTAGTSAGSAPTFTTGKAGLVTVTDGTVTWTLGGRLLLGYVSEPASTSKVTAYGLIPAGKLGSELSVNGDFASGDTGWVHGDSWTLGSGVAAANSSVDAVMYQSVVTLGKMYQLSYQVTAITSGGFTARVGGVVGTTRTTTGTFTEILGPAATTGAGIATVGATVGSVDNISIKEVTWAVGTKSYWTGSAFQQNITGLTLSGDTAGLVKVADGTTLVTTAGLLGINANGKVYEADNTLGPTPSVITFAGTTGNTNKHSGALYIAKLSGGGTSTIEINGTTTAITSAALTRVKVEDVTTASGSQLILNVGAGDKVQFLLMGLSEASFVSSIMPTAGSTATRAATSLSYPVSNIKDAAGTVYVEYFSPLATTVGDMRLLGCTGNGGETPILTNTTKSVELYDGSTIPTGPAVAPSTTAVNRVLTRWNATAGKLKAFAGGQAGTEGVYDGTFGMTSVDVGSGRAVGDARFTGYIRNVKVWNWALSDIQCIKEITK